MAADGDRPRTVWTGDCSATVDVDRCVGPRGRLAAPPGCWADSGLGEFDLGEATHRVALYECCLRHGTPFDIYRWVDLVDLAALWPRIRLPAGVRAEWATALATWLDVPRGAPHDGRASP